MEITNNTIVPQEIGTRIFTIRGMQVMLDSHLAELYHVETKQINRNVKRNEDRFPQKFMFQLSETEWEFLRSQTGAIELDEYQNSQSDTQNDNPNLKYQFGTSSFGHGGRRKLPFVFTEQGVAMLSAVLRSETAVNVSIQIMDAFVEMRKVIGNSELVIQRLDKMELKQLDADQKFEQIFKALESKNPEPEKGIFFEGQIFDAYVFVVGLLKKANSSILLIDNYVDETVLTMLAKRNPDVKATIYTQKIGPQLQLDLNKHNAQYPTIELKTLPDSHDRFLVIDQQELYHIGASLKDLGKKWFAFSRMDSLTNEVLTKLNC